LQRADIRGAEHVTRVRAANTPVGAYVFHVTDGEHSFEVLVAPWKEAD